MSAIQLSGYGDQSVLYFKSDVPLPKFTTKTQVLVKMKASSINREDCRAHQGDFFYSTTNKKGIGSDGAGIVVDFAKNVKRFHLGDHVYGLNHYHGTNAEYTIFEEKELSLIPKGIENFEEASMLPLILSRIDQLENFNFKGKSSIVYYEGEYGLLTIQLLQYFGSMVSVICPIFDHHLMEILNSLKVKIFSDFKKVDHKCDYFIDGKGGCDIMNEALHILKTSGTFITFNSPHEIMSLEREMIFSLKFTIRNLFLCLNPKCHYICSKFNHTKLEKYTNIIIDKKMIVLCSEIFPLRQINEAHLLMESGKCVGKIIIKI